MTSEPTDIARIGSEATESEGTDAGPEPQHVKSDVACSTSIGHCHKFGAEGKVERTISKAVDLGYQHPD